MSYLQLHIHTYHLDGFVFGWKTSFEKLFFTFNHLYLVPNSSGSGYAVTLL